METSLYKQGSIAPSFRQGKYAVKLDGYDEAVANDGQFSQNSQRAAAQFMGDPKPKFVLGRTGDVLAANVAAQQQIASGLLTIDNRKRLNYGAKKLNDQSAQILKRLTTGRSHCERMLRHLPDGDWTGYEFALMDYLGETEISLTVNERTFCPEAGLMAIAKTFGFTITETEVIRHISEALSPKEIAEQMNISTNTVRAHLRAIYSKTGVRGYNGTLRLVLQLLN